MNNETLPNGIPAFHPCGLLVTPELLDWLNEAIGMMVVDIEQGKGVVVGQEAPGRFVVSLETESDSGEI